jgi:hypothetical protein
VQCCCNAVTVFTSLLAWQRSTRSMLEALIEVTRYLAKYQAH